MKERVRRKVRDVIRAPDNSHNVPLNDSPPSAVETARVTMREFLARGGECVSPSIAVQKSPDLDALVYEITEHEGLTSITTGNYIGTVPHDTRHYVQIRSRFGDAFLQRMLNFANDIFVDDVELLGRDRPSEIADPARLVLHYLFTQAFERAFVMGLPRAYARVSHRGATLIGNVDVQTMIRRDLPFIGILSSTARHQIEVQAIVDVLARTVEVVHNASKIFRSRLAPMRAHLRERRSPRCDLAGAIEQARRSRTLRNPVFMPYTRVLDFALLVLRQAGIAPDHKGQQSAPAMLIDVALLFENYVRKLLTTHLPEWRVSSPAIPVYIGQFFERNMIPDIVLEHPDGRVAVLDAKYKRMKFRGRYEAQDLDRADFFQIHTYMSYYGAAADHLAVGGLLYPLEGAPSDDACMGSWLGDQRTKFIVDGIAVPEAEAGMTGIIGAEREFLDRLERHLLPQRAAESSARASAV